MNDATKPGSERLVEDLRTLLADAEELVKVTAAETGERVRDARARLSEKLKDVRVQLAETQQLLLEKSKSAAAATDRYAQDNPWRVAGIAAGLGLLLGLLLGRRD